MAYGNKVCHHVLHDFQALEFYYIAHIEGMTNANPFPMTIFAPL